MRRNPLPQFNSLQEAKEFFQRYGRLEFFGRSGQQFEYCVYNYHVQDGRVLPINIYDDGRVEYRD